jgi:DNA-binding PadR family transcriptional regulator
VTKNKVRPPLTPAVLHILLALSTEERHGYGIMKQVGADSQGKVTMGPGTLYGSLGRMMEAGLIRESDRKVDPDMDDERRVYYAITGLGRKALEAELARYRDVVAVARRLAPGARAAAAIGALAASTPGMRDSCASIRRRSASASAKAWCRASTTSAANVGTRGGERSDWCFGSSRKHPRES